MLGEFLALASCSTCWEFKRVLGSLHEQTVYRRCEVWSGQKQNVTIHHLCGKSHPPLLRPVRTLHIFSCLFSEGFWDSHRGAWLNVLDEASLDVYYNLLGHKKVRHWSFSQVWLVIGYMVLDSQGWEFLPLAVNILSSQVKINAGSHRHPWHA